MTYELDMEIGSCVLEYFYENKLINFDPELYVFTTQPTKPSYDLDSGH